MGPSTDLQRRYLGMLPKTVDAGRHSMMGIRWHRCRRRKKAQDAHQQVERVDAYRRRLWTVAKCLARDELRRLTTAAPAAHGWVPRDRQSIAGADETRRRERFRAAWRRRAQPRRPVLGLGLTEKRSIDTASRRHGNPGERERKKIQVGRREAAKCGQDGLAYGKKVGRR